MPDPAKLRELASWYRDFAERAGNPVIWEARVRTADDLEHEAARIERAFTDSTLRSRYKKHVPAAQSAI